jgi:hypothetical protein
MKRALALAALLALPLLGTACGDMKDDIASSESYLLGDALPGTNAGDFAEAKDAFNTSENAADGLGPIFNERGCGTCHQNGAIGGAGQQIERRYGTLTNGVFNGLANTGGSLRQLFGIGGFNVGGLNCQSGTDANPAPGATIFAGRLTTPLFGLGLVDSLPDARFDTMAAREPAATRGIVNRVTIALPNPADPSQTTGGTRVGRFGWKAGVPNLGQFSADAYLNEMGITTTSCIRGARNGAFATENRANRAPTNAVINGCPDDAVPGTDDDFAEETNNCAGGINELQDDVGFFTFFMAHLAPAAPGRDHRGFGSRSRPYLVQLGWPAVRELPPRRRRHLRVDLGRRRAFGHPLPSVLGLPRARHGDAGRHDRQRRRLRGGHAPHADRPAVGPALAQHEAARRTHHRYRHGDQRPQRRRRRSGNRCRKRVQRALDGAEERSDRVPQHAVVPITPTHP